MRLSALIGAAVLLFAGCGTDVVSPAPVPTPVATTSLTTATPTPTTTKSPVAPPPATPTSSGLISSAASCATAMLPESSGGPAAAVAVLGSLPERSGALGDGLRVELAAAAQVEALDRAAVAYELDAGGVSEVSARHQLAAGASLAHYYRSVASWARWWSDLPHMAALAAEADRVATDLEAACSDPGAVSRRAAGCQAEISANSADLATAPLLANTGTFEAAQAALNEAGTRRSGDPVDIERSWAIVDAGLVMAYVFSEAAEFQKGTDPEASAHYATLSDAMMLACLLNADDFS